MMITEAEVYNIAFNRNIESGLIKQSQIQIAKRNWIDSFIGSDFVKDIEADTNTYETLITQYIKPVIAWGVLYNNLNYFLFSVTDKGLIQLLVEGTASILDNQTKMEIKREIKNTIFGLLKELETYCFEEKQGSPGADLYKNFTGLELETSQAFFKGKSRKGLKYY